MDYSFFRINTCQCKTCGREVKQCQLEYWPPKMLLEGGKRYPDYLSVSIALLYFVVLCDIIRPAKERR